MKQNKLALIFKEYYKHESPKMLNLQKEFKGPREYVIDLKKVYTSIQTVLGIEKIEIGNISYVLIGN